MKKHDKVRKPKSYKFWPDDVNLYALMVDSLGGHVCFGCARPLKEDERKKKVTKLGKDNEFWIHYDRRCAELALENFKAGLR